MRLGFIVNPIAGMGGKVGLKGTDGVLEEAIARGAEAIAPKRAIEFLEELKEDFVEKRFDVLTCPGPMGEEEAKAAWYNASTISMRVGKETTAEDTKTAVKLLVAANVDIIVFVGGDGTAKDIFDALQGLGQVPVLGVPSGVKMYSGVFAVNPSDAAEVVSAFVEKRAEVEELEVMDSDEDALRDDVFNVRLYGFMKCPFLPAHIQGSKQVSPETVDERDNQLAIARFVVEEMPAGSVWILGPGTTVKRVAELLGTDKTVLGVDLYESGRAILDVDEKRILKEVADWEKVWIVLSPIGRQGILFGRGNQQISPEIIRRVGRERILVLATRSKLQSIDGGVLRVDTGNAETDELLKGYGRVVTDYREWRLVEIR